MRRIMNPEGDFHENNSKNFAAHTNQNAVRETSDPDANQSANNGNADYGEIDSSPNNNNTNTNTDSNNNENNNNNQ
jgi:hypothetical protein